MHLDADDVIFFLCATLDLGRKNQQEQNQNNCLFPDPDMLYNCIYCFMMSM